MYQKYVLLRDKAGVTDYRVAEATGIPQSTFSDWKAGRSKPKVEKLLKIAKYFGVPVEYFLEAEGSLDEKGGKMSEEIKPGLSEDKQYVTYKVETIQEVMRFLRELDTDKSIKMLNKLTCPNPRELCSELEIKLSSLTLAERKAMLYGASLPKDSETLQILNKLEEERNSRNCK